MKKKSYFCKLKMEQKGVIERMKEAAERILPAGASLWLSGSRTHGDAHPDSDYDLLIRLDKDFITGANHDNYSYPLRLLGWDMNEEINTHIYPKKEWMIWDYVPFHNNVESDKIVLK